MGAAQRRSHVFDVGGVVVCAVDDDDLLAAAHDVELVVLRVEEPEVARAQVVDAVVHEQPRVERLLCLLGAVEVPAVADVRPRDPDLADLAVGQGLARLRVHDARRGLVVGERAAAHGDQSARVRRPGATRTAWPRSSARAENEKAWNSVSGWNIVLTHVSSVMP